MRGIWCRTEVPSMVTNYEIHIYIKKGIPQNLLLRNALDYRLQDVYSVEVYTQNLILLKWNWRLKKFTVPKYTLKSAHSAQSAFYKLQHSELPPWKRTSPQEALKSTLFRVYNDNLDTSLSCGFHKCVWAKSTRPQVHIKCAIMNRTREPETESTTKKSLYVSNPLTNLIICSSIRVRWCTTLILCNVLLNACISSFHYYTSQCALTVLGYRELNKIWFIISLNLVLTAHFS